MARVRHYRHQAPNNVVGWRKTGQ